MALTNAERVAAHRARRKLQTPIQRVVASFTYTDAEQATIRRIKFHTEEARRLAETLNSRVSSRLDQEGAGKDEQAIRQALASFTRIQIQNY